MCGRFLLRCPPQSWPADLLPDGEPASELATELPDLFKPRSNISPTQPVLAIVQQEPGALRELVALTWGLVPSWAQERKIGAKMINARSETVHEKPSFRNAFSHRRCLILADGYYEWVQSEAGKQPMLIQRPDKSLFCFAGLWEINRKLPSTKDGVVDPQHPLLTCTIITTAASQAMRGIHDRMPVVMDPAHYTTWLDPGFRNADALRAWLVAAEGDFFTASPVQRVA